VTIYHNPRCGTSRNTLAMLEQAGYQPEVVEYLKTGWTAEQLKDLIRQVGGGARAILRDKGTPAAELGLLETAVSDDVLIKAMTQHPELVNRPIVVTPIGAVLARPSERVAEVLDRPIGPFVKEDGEVVPG
jgi:arsenate reductase